MNCDTIKGCVFEDSAFNLLARIESSGADVTKATAASIIWKAFNITDEVTVVTSGTLIVANVIFDTLQLDRLWAGIDAIGYNFLHVVPETVFGSPGTYRIEHKVTMTSGTSFYLHPFEITVESIWSS